MDDPYIHLAIGRNLAEFGNWGPMKGVFNSASSSPLYTLLIAGFYYIGVGGVASLLFINLVSSFGSFLAFEKIAKVMNIDVDRYFICIIAFLFSVPLYHIAYLSMEHTLHIWLILIVALKAARYFTGEKSSTKNLISMSVLTSLAIMTRYETLFIGLIIGLLLLYKRRFYHAILFAIISLLPVAIFGYISVLNGEHWLPNSVLLKGSKEGEGVMFYLRYAGRWAKRLIDVPVYGLSFAIVIFALVWKIRHKSYDTMYWYSLLVAGVFILHGSFAEFGWLGRYEAYLIALSMGSFILIVQQIGTIKNWKYVSYGIIILFIAIRTIPSTYGYRYAMSNVYDQQYQVAMFIKNYYNYDNVVINDIGAVSFFTNTTYIDLWGLASTEVANYVIENGHSDKDFIFELAKERGSKIAIVYNVSYLCIPNDWKKVASWTISNSQSATYPTVTFFAIGEEPAVLMKEVVNFSKTIPEDIKIEYFMPMPSPLSPFFMN